MKNKSKNKTDILFERIETYRKALRRRDTEYYVLELFIERTSASDNLLKFVERNTKEQEVILEARKHSLVTYVSSMEAYFKDLVGYLLDSKKISEANKREYLKSLGEVTFSLDSLLEIQEKDFSLGEIVIQTRSFQNLENINNACSILLGVKDFIAEVESFEIPDWSILLKRDYPNLREEIKEMLRLRHLVIHNAFNPEKIGREKLQRLRRCVIALLLVADDYVGERLK